MASGIRQYARTRGVPKSTIAEAIAAGHIPLNADGSINVTLADRLWLPGYRPMTGPDFYADPEVQARMDADLRRSLVDGGMTQREVDQVFADIDRLLHDEPDAVRPVFKRVSD